MFDAKRIPRAALKFPPRIYEELRKILKMAEKEIEIDIQSTASIQTTADSMCHSSSGKKREGCA